MRCDVGHEIKFSPVRYVKKTGRPIFSSAPNSTHGREREREREREEDSQEKLIIA